MTTPELAALPRTNFILLVYSTQRANTDGSFTQPPGAWQIGGGKRCLLHYPA